MDDVKCGLLGKKLGYSYSKLIYEYCGKEYNLIEKEEDELDLFFKERKFDFINVTIPYKEKVIKYLDILEGVSKELKVVNLIINKNGKLYGYNTDYDGFLYLLKEFDELKSFKDKNILVLGTGATSKTIRKVFDDNLIRYKIASSKSGFDYQYDELSNIYFDYIVNATPVGTHPNIDNKIDAKANKIIDVIYNPYRSRLALDNHFDYSGLDMLIIQAIKTMEIVFGKTPKSFESIKKYLINKLMNIVLIGMPGSGKTTIGRLLAQRLNKDFCDSDEIIERTRSIKDIFTYCGEDRFRMIEHDIIKDVSKSFNLVIATGGGVVTNDDNMKHLMANGIIIYIKRDLKDIYKDINDRPLVKNEEDLIRLYDERSQLYLKYSDYVVENENISETVDKIINLI